MRRSSEERIDVSRPSISLFEIFSQAEDSTRVAAEWALEEDLESLLADPEVRVAKVFACVLGAPILV
ncbi:MAG: hypothetical protein H0W90_12620 [Actinobacteria bacterium]|nr:hypothetical protein [Actinomycetota bacterium]